jgi:aminopeptidase N
VPAIASYEIEVTLDTETKTLTGHETVTYANHSGDPIPELIFHLYLNAFRDRDSIFLREGGASHRGSDWDPGHAGWIQVSGMQLADGSPLVVEEIEDGTLARAALPAPVAPGGRVQIELDFTARLPRIFARTGYADEFFMIGQWFPKLGVWQEGAWNAYPFHANSEFYADFGTYDVTITSPSGYVIGATGLPSSVVDNGDGTQTAHYRAEAVIDFAWTASPRFQEAHRLVQDIDLVYLYLPEHRWTVERVLHAAEAALNRYSRWYGPYPYSRLTVVDVPDDAEGAGGMEYPMLVTAGTTSFTGIEGLWSKSADRSLELVTVHEIGHQWWQTTVAFNEAEEPWLDEGFTEYSTVRVMEEVYGAETSAVDSPYLRVGSLDTRRMEYLSNPQVPMYGLAWDFGMLEYAVAAYSKPTLALRTLERTLGEQTMLEIMSTFYQRYRFAHPTTEDFRAVAEQVSGENLDWFFAGVVYGDGVLNYRVTELGEHSVTVERQGDLRIPTEVLVTFADGSTILEPWDGRDTPLTLSYPQRSPVLSAKVDPGQKIALDLQWSDNGLSSQLQVSSWLALLTRLIYALQNALLALGGL